METRDCTICGRRIHPERLAASPRTITCSKTCAHARYIRDARTSSRDANSRRRARERAERMAGAVGRRPVLG